jgi:hypothetical protein
VVNPHPTIPRTIAWLVLGSIALTGQARTASAEGRGGQDVLCFDFDERPQGNMGELPMHWRRHRAPGFPEYARGGFDTDDGCGAPPSFYLELDGRSCAFEYIGQDIRVEQVCPHRVSARIRPDRLLHARAFLTAQYQTSEGPLGEPARSVLVGGPGSPGGWQEVHIDLPVPPAEARTIGLSVWVAQEVVWQPDPPAHHIQRLDVQGGAWFDDIVIRRLPAIALTSPAAGRAHLFTQEERPAVLVRGGGQGRDAVPARLRVSRAGGEVVYEEALVLADEVRIDLPDLPPGHYAAQLELQKEIEGFDAPRLDLIKLAGPAAAEPRWDHRLGVTLEARDPGSWPAAGRLLDLLGCALIKVPLPCGSGTTPELDAFLKDRQASGTAATGVLEFDRSRNAGSDTLASASAPAAASSRVWQTCIGDLAARYATEIEAWQVGPDRLPPEAGPLEMREVLAAVRGVFTGLSAAPRLVVPGRLGQVPDTRFPGAALTLSIPPDMPATSIPTHIDHVLGGSAPAELWVRLESAAPRHSELPFADDARRVILALQSRARRVFVDQPWAAAAGPDGSALRVADHFQILRTLITWLDDASPRGALHVPGSATCVAFDRDGQAVLALWDDLAPAEGRDYVLELCGATAATDLWGQTWSLPAEPGGRRIRLSPQPVLVHGVSSWLVAFQSRLRFEPQVLPSQTTPQPLSLVVYNPGSDPISGIITLQRPPGWHLRSTVISFAVEPGEEQRHRLLAQPALHEPAGVRDVQAEVNLDAEQLYRFTMQLPLRVDLPDMKVEADLRVAGEEVIVRHSVTNLSAEVVTFRSRAAAEGRRRQSLNIIGLRPGQTAVKSHVLSGASDLSGRSVHVALQQVRGPRVHELILDVP